MNPKVDEHLRKAKKWREESYELRRMILDCSLIEELKWGQPCYTLQGKNIVLIGKFKEYCSLLFFKGALLKDAHGILQRPGKHTQAGRLIKLTSLQEIKEMEAILKAYIQEAIEVEKAGLKVKLKKHSEFKVPEELQKKMEEGGAFKAAFQALTPGRQRAYFYFFSAPKLSKTREARVEKCVPRILEGKGLLD
jgi:uncharacterized protein YdeI (YjbR/CyaY-like superfamily)